MGLSSSSSEGRVEGKSRYQWLVTNMKKKRYPKILKGIRKYELDKAFLSQQLIECIYVELKMKEKMRNKLI